MPLRKSLVDSQYAIFLPHENPEETFKSKEIIKECDIVFAEVSFPATGMGIELGWSDGFAKPIVCLYRKGAKISRSLRFITNDFIEYDDSDDLIRKVLLFLQEKYK